LHVVLPDAPPWSIGSRLPDFPMPPTSAGRAVVSSVADPLMLVARLTPPEFLRQRADYLSLLGLLPEAAGFVLGHLPGLKPDAQARAGHALESVARRAGRDLVVIDAPLTGGASSGKILPGADLTTVDLLATVAAAGLVITDSPATLALATGLARPALGVADQDVETGSSPARANKGWMVGGLDELVALAPVAMADTDLEQRREGVANSLDLFFNDLSVALLSSGVRELSTTASQRLTELNEQVRTLETVNAGLQQRLVRERTAMAGYVWAGRHPGRAMNTTAAQVSASERALWDLYPSEAEVQRLENEIAAIYATKTMRLLQPVRRVYARLRTLRS
jgi:hypothetical protein